MFQGNSHSGKSSSSSSSKKSSDPEEQMILRVPNHLAEKLRQMLKAKGTESNMEFSFGENGRNAQFKMGDQQYNATLLDLPCIVESLKTLDQIVYYKSADIGQMLVVHDEPKPVIPNTWR
eukprot:TRINITY_DN5176_c0_g1_i1.p1 TRINITY_DN5176_c0_g1~~TRINITY_DN5176_c0_g1_i1.p1  ORF type:complete len:133 (+),score=29.96 TRINITY_DN5176_c0_g1_i1:41-400(+)